MSDAQNICELSVETDSEGYLVDPNDWSEEIATLLAKQEGLELGSDHWLVIRFMRTWLEEHGVTPDARHVMKAIGGERDAGRARLFELFPLGYVKQACKIAGMRRPRAWSTG
jgi:tRNA 2-thiouridine synthesizing protein E